MAVWARAHHSALTPAGNAAPSPSPESAVHAAVGETDAPSSPALLVEMPAMDNANRPTEHVTRCLSFIMASFQNDCLASNLRAVRPRRSKSSHGLKGVERERRYLPRTCPRLIVSKRNNSEWG